MINKASLNATNTSLNSKINEVKSKKLSITNLATDASLNAKINEVKSEIPNITNLATTTSLTTFEIKCQVFVVY